MTLKDVNKQKLIYFYFNACGRTFDNFISPGHLRSINPSDKRTDTVKHTYKIRTNDDRYIVKDRQQKFASTFVKLTFLKSNFG